MELIKSINNNQIEKLKESGLNVINWEVTSQTADALTYFIDMENLNIIITCNWESKDGAIHVYDNKDNPITNHYFKGINSVEDLNKEVTSFITNNINNF